jgi:hypothetical protein
MQLHDLHKPLDQLSDEELMERLRVSRHNRKTARPAAKAHAKRATNKVENKKVAKTEDLLKSSGLSTEELIALLRGE